MPEQSNHTEKNRKRVKKITEAVLSLPVLPTITSKILEVVDNPRSSAGDLANLVAKDQVLTAKVLKMANSPFYGLPQRVYTVKQAVVLMGFDSLKEISLSLSIFNIFKNEKSSPYFNITEFWKHSIGVGLGTQLIAKKVHYRDTGMAFTAGLLHDLGKLVLNHYLPHEFNQVQDLVNEKGMSLKEAELLVWGVEHGQVGAWLGERWRLPSLLTETMQYHHQPLKSEKEKGLCVLLYLADALVAKSGLGKRGTNNKGSLSEEVKENLLYQFNIDDAQIEKFEEELLFEFQTKASDLVSEI